MEKIIKVLELMSLEASVLIILTLILRRICNKLPKIYTYAMWLIVILRLVLPVFVESSYGFLPAVNSAVESTFSADKNSEEEQIVNPDEMLASYTDSHGKLIINETENAKETVWGRIANFCTGIYAAVIWGIGIAVVIGIYFFQYIKLKKIIRFAVRDDKGYYLCENIDTPFVMGLFAPKIYLPYNMEPNDIEAVLMHERVHIKHCDLQLHFFINLIRAFYWWNPFIWIAVKCINNDIEIMCDESVLRNSGKEQRREYSKVLLDYAVKKEYFSVRLEFGTSVTEQRIAHIMKGKPPKKTYIIVLTVILGIFFAGCLTIPAAKLSGSFLTGLSKTAKDGYILDVADSFSGKRMSPINNQVIMADVTGDSVQEYVKLSDYAQLDIYNSDKEQIFHDNISNNFYDYYDYDGALYMYTYQEGAISRLGCYEVYADLEHGYLNMMYGDVVIENSIAHITNINRITIYQNYYNVTGSQIVEFHNNVQTIMENGILIYQYRQGNLLLFEGDTSLRPVAKWNLYEGYLEELGLKASDYSTREEQADALCGQLKKVK